MTRTILVTGSASGIGKAIAARLADAGDRVIGVDLKDADIAADLATAEGRAALAQRAAALAPEGLDGVVAAAGVSNFANPALTVSVNYFGVVATLEGLLPLLAKRPAPNAIAICSTAAFLPTNADVVAACLEGDEPRARELTAANVASCYSDSKLALSRWVRRTAVSADWAGANVMLNGVAPGVIKTPMSMPLFSDPEMVKRIQMSNPIAVPDYAEPEAIAETVSALFDLKSRYLLGQILFVDGGSDAILRPDHV